MEVVYKTSMIQQIIAAVGVASIEKRSIEKIILNKEEWGQLSREANPYLSTTITPGFHTMVAGVRVEERK